MNVTFGVYSDVLDPQKRCSYFFFFVVRFNIVKAKITFYCTCKPAKHLVVSLGCFIKEIMYFNEQFCMG